MREKNNKFFSIKTKVCNSQDNCSLYLKDFFPQQFCIKYHQRKSGIKRSLTCSKFFNVKSRSFVLMSTYIYNAIFVDCKHLVKTVMTEIYFDVYA